MCFSVRPLAFLLLALSCVLPACRTTGLENDEQTAEKRERRNLARTARSLAPWKEVRIAGIAAENFARVSIARLLSGDTNIQIVQTGRTTYHFSLEPSPGGGGYGSAVPISSDGYFLTAAHCVSQEKPVKVLAWTTEKKLAARTARVVWVGSKEKADVALLKADIRPAFWLSLARDRTMSPGEGIMMAGFGGPYIPEKAGDRRRVAGGTILKSDAPQSDPGGAKWRAFNHTGPMLPGDSGGPVIAADGTLLGINSSMDEEYYETWFGPWRRKNWTTAIAPDAAWISCLIEQDRRRKP